MKQLLLLAGLASTDFAARAQESRPQRPIVSVGVYGPSANVGLQVEQPLSRHFTLGARASRQFSPDFRGYQGGLVGRYYFRPTAPTGLYLQAMASLFDMRATVESFYPGATYRSTSEYNTKGTGAGLGLGYQWRFAQHLVASVGLGFKAMPNGLGTCDCAYTRDWYAVGQPGSVLDGQLSFGYAF
jgi:hypothetical protein